MIYLRATPTRRSMAVNVVWLAISLSGRDRAFIVSISYLPPNRFIRALIVFFVAVPYYSPDARSTNWPTITAQLVLLDDVSNITGKLVIVFNHFFPHLPSYAINFIILFVDRGI